MRNPVYAIVFLVYFMPFNFQEMTGPLINPVFGFLCLLPFSFFLVRCVNLVGKTKSALVAVFSSSRMTQGC